MRDATGRSMCVAAAAESLYDLEVPGWVTRLAPQPENLRDYRDRIVAARPDGEPPRSAPASRTPAMTSGTRPRAILPGLAW